MKIIYVDDNAERSRSIVTVLRQQGHEVVSAGGVDELPALLSNGNKPELVIFGDRIEQDEIKRLILPAPPPPAKGEGTSLPSSEPEDKTVWSHKRSRLPCSIWWRSGRAAGPEY